MLLQPVNLGSQNATSAVNGATTEPRIRINRPDDENARRKGSRAPGQRKDFSQCMRQSTTHSTSNATSSQAKRTPRSWESGSMATNTFACARFTNAAAPANTKNSRISQVANRETVKAFIFD